MNRLGSPARLRGGGQVLTSARWSLPDSSHSSIVSNSGARVGWGGVGRRAMGSAPPPHDHVEEDAGGRGAPEGARGRALAGLDDDRADAGARPGAAPAFRALCRQRLQTHATAVNLLDLHAPARQFHRGSLLRLSLGDLGVLDDLVDEGFRLVAAMRDRKSTRLNSSHAL